MPAPRFSIVIPTRDRAETLRHAITSCLAQSFEDCEVVVFDNGASERTKAVVDEFDDPRLQLHRSGRLLSMQDSWNAAYESSRGEWVTVIGDDDGFTPFGLRRLADAIDRTQAAAVRWDYAVYSWPTIINPAIANYLKFGTKRTFEWLESRETIRAVLDGRCSPGLLPNVYHGAVSRRILADVHRRTGRVFAGFHPDTYSSFTVAYLAERHLSLSLPISVSGFSKASNNIAFSFERRKNVQAEQQRLENERHGIGMDRRVPDLPCLIPVLVDSFLHAKAKLFPHDDTLTIDRRRVASRCLEEMPVDTLGEWDAMLAEVRRSVSDDPALAAWFDGEVAKRKPAVKQRDEFRPAHLGLRWDELHIDAGKLRISNVAEAAAAVDAILDYDRDGIDLVDKTARSRRSLARTILSRLGRRQSPRAAV